MSIPRLAANGLLLSLGLLLPAAGDARPDSRDPVIQAVPATIHEIQGSGLRSPLAGTEVVVEGIITATTDSGYFIQSPDDATDGLPETSEALFVQREGSDIYLTSKGDRVVVYGRVEEVQADDQPHRLTVTQLVDVTNEFVMESGVPLPAPVLLTPEDLSSDADPTALERLEGMRVRADQLQVVGASPAYIDPVDQSVSRSGIFYAVLGTSVFADALPFRQPGLPPFTAEPLPAGKSLPFHDGNPQVLAIDGNRQRGDSDHDFDLGLNDWVRNVVGVLDYQWRYTVLVDPTAPVTVETGMRGAGAYFFSPGEVKLAWMDLGGLYDASDDPARDEPVPSPAIYQARLAKIAKGLCNFLALSEVIAVGGVENIQVLRDLAALADTNPSGYCPWPREYEAVLVEGSDASGLDLGFLVAGYLVDGVSPRVQVQAVETIAAGETSINPIGPADPLFAQLPLAVSLLLTDEQGRQAEFTAVNLRLQDAGGADSLFPDFSSGWGTLGERIMTLRARQAARIASWIEQRQQANPDEAIALLGGFEADAFNDGRVDVMGIITGRPAPADQTWVALPSPVTTPLANLTLLAPTYERYNANDRGEFRALDHIVLNQALRRRFAITRAHPRMNADFPASARAAGDPGFTFGARDPLMARMAVAAFIDADTRVSVLANDTYSPSRDNTFYISVGNDGPDIAPSLEMVLSSSLAPTQWSLSDAWPGWICGDTEAEAGGSRVVCHNDSLTSPTGDGFDIQVPADAALDGTSATFTATLTGAHNDPDLSNNQSSRTLAFDGRVDLNVELMPINGVQDLVPGDAGGWVVVVERSPLNPPGPVTITLDIDAAANEVTLNLANGYVTCDEGVATGPRRSRFTCTAVNDDFLQVAVFGLSFATDLLDGGRVVGLTAEARAATPDPTPDDNIASASRRVSDDTDLAVTAPINSHDVATLSDQPFVSFVVSNNVRGVARNARVEILVDLPPSAIGPVEPSAHGQSPPIWSCQPAEADGTGSRITCLATGPFVQPAFPAYFYGFAFRVTPPLRPGVPDYVVTTRVAVSSDSDEQAPADNLGEVSYTVDQTTDLALLGTRALLDPVAEPTQALFEFRAESFGANVPRNPRVRLELDAVLAPADLEIRGPFGTLVACMPEAAPAGRTALVCPVNPGDPGTSLYVRTRPDLVGRVLTLRASALNDLPDVDASNDTGVASTNIVSEPSLCIATCGQPGPRPLPFRLLPDQVNTLVYETMNQGPSTAPDSVARVRLPLPASRLSASFQGQACDAATDIGGGRSEVRCAMGTLAGDRVLRLLAVTVDLTGITSGDYPIEVELTTPLPGNGSGDDLLRMTLPVATPVDLSAQVSAKPSRHPAPAVFWIEPTQSRSHDGLSRIMVRIESPGATSVADLRIQEPGWSCWLNVSVPALQEWECHRYLSFGADNRIAVEVPTHAFTQIGRLIRVTARHYFPEDALEVDTNPGNDEATATLMVEGRRTQSVKPPVTQGARRPAPAPARVTARREAKR